jgi:hypothetical protein
MKMDKESLVKNRFWIGLIAFGPLWLIIFFVAVFTSGSSAGGQKTILGKTDSDLKSINGPKNERFTELVHQKELDLEKQKDKVWAAAWQGQKDLMTWPAGVTNRADLEANAYFGQELSINERTQFRGENGYATQLPEEGIKNWLAPHKEINADWNRLIHRVDFNKAGADKAPTNEEVWLAQEDIWVQQELLAVVASALTSASRFENVAHFKRVEIPKAELDKLNGVAAAPANGAAPPAPVPTPPVVPAAPGVEEPANKKAPTIVRQRFHTPHWRLDLVLEQNGKELSVSTQTALIRLDSPRKEDKPPSEIGIDLSLWQNSARPPKPQLLHFAGKPGQPLTPAKAVPLPGFATNLDDLPLEINFVADTSDPQPQGATRMRFRNPSWELELIIVQPEGKQPYLSHDSKLTNINSTRRTLALGMADFWVYQGLNKPVTRFSPPGNWLGWGQTTAALPKEHKGELASYDPRLPLQVYQGFNPYTSPIKQINAIEIPGSPECQSFNSHRTANLQLKPAAQFPVEAPKDAAPTGGAGGGMMGASGGSMMGASGSMMGPSGGSGGSLGVGVGGNAAADSSRTPNGINRNRYIAVTDQVRHMPVALSLLVEQTQVQDVLTAVTNSRLRIQITQVQWKRYEGYKPGEMLTGSSGPGAGMVGAAGGAGASGRGLIPGGMVGGSNPGPSGGGPPLMPPGGMRGSPSGMSGGMPRFPGGMSGMPNFPGGMSGMPRFPGSMSGMSGMPGFPGSGGAATVTGDQSDPNVVEVAVYGIAALYERYPPKPPAKPDGAAPTAVPPK